MHPSKRRKTEYHVSPERIEREIKSRLGLTASGYARFHRYMRQTHSSIAGSFPLWLRCAPPWQVETAVVDERIAALAGLFPQLPDNIVRRIRKCTLWAEYRDFSETLDIDIFTTEHFDARGALGPCEDGWGLISAERDMYPMHNVIIQERFFTLGSAILNVIQLAPVYPSRKGVALTADFDFDFCRSVLVPVDTGFRLLCAACEPESTSCTCPVAMHGKADLDRYNTNCNPEWTLHWSRGANVEAELERLQRRYQRWIAGENPSARLRGRVLKYYRRGFSIDNHKEVWTFIERHDKEARQPLRIRLSEPVGEVSYCPCSCLIRTVQIVIKAAITVANQAQVEKWLSTQPRCEHVLE